jgi:glyoxylase-like metal-dependent hydrolase (beta-lactamase superfamily II)
MEHGTPELKHFSVGPMDNNVYILVDTVTNDSLLFDAPFEAEKILEALEGTNLQAILMTHTDRDHVQALEQVRSATRAPVGVHPADASGLPAPADFELHDGDTLRYGNMEIKVLHTPGHTPGGVGFVIGNILISGDTLFPGGPGNTAREGGNFPQIIDGIRSKYFTLPDETQVYPGHGKSTTIGAEKPHLQEWIDRGS